MLMMAQAVREWVSGTRAIQPRLRTVMEIRRNWVVFRLESLGREVHPGQPEEARWSTVAENYLPFDDGISLSGVQRNWNARDFQRTIRREEKRSIW